MSYEANFLCVFIFHTMEEHDGVSLKSETVEQGALVDLTRNDPDAIMCYTNLNPLIHFIEGARHIGTIHFLYRGS